ncbi:MAG: alpha/beta hydrolase [Bacteroidales bacterium]|jgi:acetyl esterase/lipase
MKRITLILAFSLLYVISLYAQEEYTNKYAMKLSREEDGRFALINREKYSKIIDLDKVQELLVPYTYKPALISSKDYDGIVTKEYVYKTYPTYSLKLAVDFALSEKPSPFMVYIHGGGWARGDFSANRDISQYCAKKAGITGVRISYTLADKPGANILITVQDVKDAVKWVQNNAKELNVNPDIFGFLGGSAGGHLSAVAALSIPGAKVLVGVSGIYNLQSAKISSAATDPQRLAYFNNKDPKKLEQVSPVNLINKNNLPAIYLIHGTGDITVEWQQSQEFADKLKENRIKILKLELYPNYDHNLSSTKSDMKEKLFLEAFNFIVSNLK